MTISIRALTKVYRIGVEKVHALQDVDLDIARNDFVAIMGASGSGKSTMLNILGCLDRPTSGSYTLSGKPTHKMGAGELARVRNEEIGFVFQSFELLPRATALKNVMLPLLYSKRGWWKARRLAKRALERVGLGDRMHHKPNQLSGGQRQRVAAARAIVNNPSILLADEPTGNLDSATTEEIIALFEQLHDDGQTIVIVTHEEDVAGHARRIVRLRDGRVLSDLPASQDPDHLEWLERARKRLDARAAGDAKSKGDGDAVRANGAPDAPDASHAGTRSRPVVRPARRAVAERKP